MVFSLLQVSRLIPPERNRARLAIDVGVGHLDVAAGIQRDASWADQAGVGPADDGDGSGVAVAPLGVDSDGAVAGVGGINVSTRVNCHKFHAGKASPGSQRGHVAVARGGISRHSAGAIICNEERRGGVGAIGAARETMKADRQLTASRRDETQPQLSVCGELPILGKSVIRPTQVGLAIG